MKNGQAELLFEVIEDALKKAKIKKTRIDFIVVGIGPGNFTGIRIGLAAAKGLSLSLKVPISGVIASKHLFMDKKNTRLQ